MKQETQEEIRKTLESIEGIERAEVDPLLLDRILSRIREDKAIPSSNGSSFGFLKVAAIAIIIFINGFAALHYINKCSQARAEYTYKSLSSELGLNNTYNY